GAVGRRPLERRRARVRPRPRRAGAVGPVTRLALRVRSRRRRRRSGADTDGRRHAMTTVSEGPRTVEDAVSGLDIRAQAFIDGSYVDSLSGETFDCVSPIRGGAVAKRP